MAKKPEDFMHYIMQSRLMVCDHFLAEIDDLMIFSHERSSIARQIVASILYRELAWFKGYLYTFAVIPPQLERRALYPKGAPLPERPKESRSCHAVGLKENCQVWWCYLLALLQYWKDAKSPFPYRGPLRHDSNLLMYVYHHIKCLLHMGRVELQLYSIKNQMPWMAYSQTDYMLDQITKQRETYAAIGDELQDLKNWLHKCYEAEADAEIYEVEQCGGDIWKMSWPRISKDLCPGNEDLYVAPEKKETHLKRRKQPGQQNCHLRTKNNEALDYYDNLDQDTEMASSQDTVLMSSQDTAPASSQETVPMSSQESKATASMSSQESATQETTMPSLETATGTTILDATDEAHMEDETCLEGPTLKCSLQEERALLNTLLAESVDHLEDVPLGYLSLIEARINEIWRIKVSRMPVASPRVVPGLPPPLPIPMPQNPAATSMLSEAIYSAASNLGTSVPHQIQRMPMCPPDQAETDQAVRVLEGINKVPSTMLDRSEPRTVP